jgi:hypothetical protein
VLKGQKNIITVFGLRLRVVREDNFFTAGLRGFFAIAGKEEEVTLVEYIFRVKPIYVFERFRVGVWLWPCAKKSVVFFWVCPICR